MVAPQNLRAPMDYENELRNELAELAHKKDEFEQRSRRQVVYRGRGSHNIRGQIGRGGVPRFTSNIDTNRKRQQNDDVVDPLTEDHPKKRRLLSAILDPRNSNGTHRHNDDYAEESSKPVTAKVYTSRENIQRNRRMFGALMGHLGKAKKQIENDSDLFKRQDSLETEAERKDREETLRLAAIEKKLVGEKKLKEASESDHITTKYSIAMIKLKTASWIRQNQLCCGYLKTISLPPLYYLPGKHTEETKSLVALSRESYEDTLKTKQQEDEAAILKLEMGLKAREEKRYSKEEEFETQVEQETENMEIDTNEGLKEDIEVQQHDQQENEDQV